jgi:hypothetical protein
VQGPEIVRGATQEVVEVAVVAGPAGALVLPGPVGRIQPGSRVVQPTERDRHRLPLLGAYLPLQLDALLAVKPEIPARGPAGEAIGPVAEADDTPQHPAVPAAIPERERIAVTARCEVLAAGFPAPAPHLEDVGEVGAEVHLDPVVQRRAQIAGEGHPLDQPIAQRQLAADVDHVAGIPEIAAEREVVHRQVDQRAVGAGHLGREQGGRSPPHGEAVVAENAGVVLEQAQRAGAGRHDVAVGVDQEEVPVVLEDQRPLGHPLVGAGDLAVPDRLLHGDGAQLLGRERRGHAAVIGRRLECRVRATAL